VKIHEKSFAGVGRLTPYLVWAAEGWSPDEIKARVISILRPYFNNPSVVTNLPVAVLGFEAVFIDRIQGDPWAVSMLTGVLSEYRAALSQNQQASIEALTAWDDKIARAVAEFYSLYLMEVDKVELELDEFRLEILRIIGGLLEACIQPHLRALLHQVRVRRSTRGDKAHLESLKFGEVVEELSRTLRVQGLLAPPPWNVKMHIFRNIAQHHSASIRNDRIVCNYRAGQHTHQIEFSRSDMLALAQRLQQVLGILRTARTIFYLDNIAKIENESTSAIRPDIAFLFFTVGIATQGFEVVALDISGSIAHLQVQDVTNGDALDRGVHASQFLVELWAHCQTPQVRVSYLDRSGQIRLVADANSTDCEDIVEGRTPFEALAARVVFKTHTGCSKSSI
jgi:hypothetical protein